MLAGARTNLLDRRLRSRATTFKHAKIMFNEDKCILDAMLKNVSAYGATLEVSETEKLPEIFNLHLVRDEIKVSCQVKWRLSDSVGVAF